MRRKKAPISQTKKKSQFGRYPLKWTKMFISAMIHHSSDLMITQLITSIYFIETLSGHPCLVLFLKNIWRKLVNNSSYNECENIVNEKHGFNMNICVVQGNRDVNRPFWASERNIQNKCRLNVRWKVLNLWMNERKDPIQKYLLSVSWFAMNTWNWVKTSLMPNQSI